MTADVRRTILYHIGLIADNNKNRQMPVFYMLQYAVSWLTAKKLFLIYIPIIIPMTADAAMKAIGWIFLRGVYLIQTKATAASMIAGQ